MLSTLFFTWGQPKVALQLLVWYNTGFSFRDHLVTTRWPRVSSIFGSVAQRLVDIRLHSLFSLRTNNSSQKSYAYTKFPEHGLFIRLLESRRNSIFPLFGHRSLEFNIRIFPLDSAPPYTALSYMWGDPTRNKCIAVHDGTTCSILAITTSAMECLLAVRTRRRHIWIDSICINQSDNDEKMKQVGMMRDIYRSAAEVAAILGNSVMATVSPTLDRDTSEILRHSRKHYLSNAENSLRQRILQQTNNPREEKYLDFYVRMVTDNRYPLRPGALRLLCHPYWTRTWIIQEITVPSHVVVYLDGSFRELDSCFKAAEDYDDLAKAVAGPSLDPNKAFSHILQGVGRPSNSLERVTETELSRIYSQGRDRLLSIQAIRNQYHDSPKSIEIQDAMLISMNSFATDSRDKVFGVIGLLRNNSTGAVGNGTNAEQGAEAPE